MGRQWKDNRDNEMIGDALGELQGKIIKGTITKANADKNHNYYGNLSEPKLPATSANEWYVKKDVIGMPGYKQQNGRGTPRVIVLVDGQVPKDAAWFSPHYSSFEELGADFFKRGKPWKDYFSK